MKKRKGFTLIEIMLAFLLLSIITMFFLFCLTSSYTFLFRTKANTLGTFDAVEVIEDGLRDTRGIYFNHVDGLGDGSIPDNPLDPVYIASLPQAFNDPATFVTRGPDATMTFFDGFCTDGVGNNINQNIEIHVAPIDVAVMINNADDTGRIDQGHLYTFAAKYGRNNLFVPPIAGVISGYMVPVPGGLYAGVTSYARINAADPVVRLTARAEFPTAAEIDDATLMGGLALINYGWYSSKEGFYIPVRERQNLSNFPLGWSHEAFPHWSLIHHSDPTNPPTDVVTIFRDYTNIIGSNSSLRSNPPNIFVPGTRQPNPAIPIGVSERYAGRHLMCIANAGGNSGKLSDMVSGNPTYVSGLPVCVQTTANGYQVTNDPGGNPLRLNVFTHLDASMIYAENLPLTNSDVSVVAVGADALVNRWINISDDTGFTKDAMPGLVPVAPPVAPFPAAIVPDNNSPTLHIEAFNAAPVSNQTRHFAQYVSFDVNAATPQSVTFRPRTTVSGTAFNPNNFTIFVVARSNAAPGSTDPTRVLSWINGARSWDLHMDSFSMNNGGGSNDTAFPSNAVVATDWHLLRVETNGGIATLTIDDDSSPLPFTTAVNAMLIGDCQIYVGNNPEDVSGDTFSGVDVAEIIICDGSLTAEQKYNVSRYLNEKFRLW